VSAEQIGYQTAQVAVAKDIDQRLEHSQCQKGEKLSGRLIKVILGRMFSLCDALVNVRPDTLPAGTGALLSFIRLPIWYSEVEICGLSDSNYKKAVCCHRSCRKF
jgi:hypothetical protein